MIIKSLVIIAFILIIISLGFALFHLLNRKNEEPSEKTVKALTFRITLSILLFIFIFIAVATGMFKPHGLGVKMHMQRFAPADRALN
jgi:RsiW-degrading membrane proteinase PrsW (M82 family)